MPDVPSLALLVSAASFVLSGVALLITYKQKARQDRLGVRKTLTDTIQMMSATNIAFDQLVLQPPTPERMALRRSLNSQRRYLAEHAGLLATEIPALATDIDHTFIARAFDAVGDLDRAERHWKKSVEASVSPALRAFNLRGYARFMFSLGNPQEGRRLYQQALEAPLPDNDRSRYSKADTFVMWATAERDYGFQREGERLRDQAVVEANRIGTPSMRNDLLDYIARVWQPGEQQITSVAVEPGPTPRQQ